MKVSKEEILHIAKLADLKLEENQIEDYILNLQDILNFANIVKEADISGLSQTINANDSYNVFRKDEIKSCEDRENLLQNAPEHERGMFKIPKVIQ